ncbi:MAG TPA: gluconate 2-dehydrogenase subunit 3 family protein [Gemmatimonadales bacterium]|nr:gluconate 2-dehydrogenase subunit 3 family protein [Gemmatimonadales bacterium]
MSEAVTRREVVELLAAVPFVGALGLHPIALQRAARQARQALTGPYEPKFFTSHEWDTVRVLVDLVVPKDERSGSATDAGVPEFMDFILMENPDEQLWMRGGLAWLDTDCRERFSKDFLTADAAQRTAVLDDISWPAKAKPAVSQGVAFFNRFRDFTASGFYSSEMGVKDLQYQGNVFLTEWTGCPPEQLKKLGVSYP